MSSQLRIARIGEIVLTDRLPPQEAYLLSASLICARLKQMDINMGDENALARAERFAFHIRKIVEGVAFAALSAAEHRNKNILEKLRTKSADQLLHILNRRDLLRLPRAQYVKKSTRPGYRLEVSGVGDLDLAVKDLKSMYKRSSNLIHERHPERLLPKTLAIELSDLENDAARLRSWLWSHIMFLGGAGFLVQMGLVGTDSFMVDLQKIGDLPAGFANNGQ